MENKTLYYSTIILATLGVFILVHFTGGVGSYFVFLYILPVLLVVGKSHTKDSSMFVALVGLMLILEGCLDIVVGMPNALGMTGFHLWALGLTSAYVWYLAVGTGVQQKQEESRIEQIEEIGKLKDEFIFIISHELRSPITAIRGYLELILTDKKEKLPPPLKETLVSSFYTGNRLGNLVSMLLEISRLETGKIKFFLQKTNLFEAVESAMRALSIDPASKKVEIVVEVDRQESVLIDGERLIEVLTVLLENAVQFTPEGKKVLVTASRESDRVKLKVTDSGVGIAPELKKQVFNKFYKIARSDGKEAKGLGLGLYMSKNILKAMKAGISLETEMGKGTSFILDLPTGG